MQETEKMLKKQLKRARVQTQLGTANSQKRLRLDVASEKDGETGDDSIEEIVRPAEPDTPVFIIDDD